jgi:P-loop Domain of unknown function (DUF2791)
VTRPGHVSARLAIEALRAGVPNGEAIRRLGCPDDQIEARFEIALDNAVDAAAFGFALAGGFGAGKSHLLGYLREVALLRDFVVSTVTVSKETPLSVPGVTYAAAIRNATMRGVNDDAVTLALAKVERIEGAVESLELWASKPEAAMSPVFSAVLHLLTRSTDAELRHSIEAFLAGGKPPLPPLRRALKDKRVRSLFDLAPVAAGELVRQRMRFMPQLFCAAGFAGWVVLLDEVELIGRYGPLQRALAYAELAQWLGLDETVRIPGILAVCAITDDYVDAVINAKQDDEKLTERLRLRAMPRHAEWARLAMRAIESAMKLTAPDDAALHGQEVTIRECYTEAYGWAAPPAEIGARQVNRTMRHHIRGWILQWDMLRIAGIRARAIETVSITDYSEDERLTETPEGFNAPD